MDVSSLFLVSNDNATHKNDKLYGKKLQKLIPNIHETSIIDYVLHDPNKVIYNFLDYRLTDSDKLLLIRGRNFTIPRGGSRTAATSKMELFVIIVNG